MPKRLPPNNRPWPQNLLYDFRMHEDTTAADAEAFISSLPTSERNKAFLFLRYRDGKTYNEIADEYGLTSTGVRLAVKAMWEKFGGSTATPAAIEEPDLAPQSAAATLVSTPATPAALQPPTPPVANVAPQSAATEARPLSLNLASIRRFLNLTPEEFTRPMHIDSGESLINRLESGFSRPSGEILDLICEAWGISRSYLLTGTGEMFETGSGYCGSLTTLLKKYLAVATFNHKGQQYWKGALVDDLGRLINVAKLKGAEMCRVVRTLYDYLDVEQFAELLERMGR